MPASAPVLCASCGAPSATGADYHVVRGRTACPLCAPALRAASAGSWLGALILLTVTARLIAAWVPGFGPAWFLFNGFVAAAFAVALVIPHELGHVVAAKLLGLRVRAVEVGLGRVLASGRVLGVALTLRVYPVSGLTRVRFDTARHYRARLAGLVLGGPAVHALVFALAVSELHGARVFRQMLLGFTPALDLAYAALVGLVVNLLPIRITAGDQRLPSDGAQLFGAFRLSDEEIAQRLAVEMLDHGELVAEGRMDAAIASLERAAERAPTSVGAWLLLGSLLSTRERWDEALEALRAARALAAPGATLWGAVNELLAIAAINRGGPGDLDEAERAVEAAWPTHAWTASLPCSRAMLRILRGDLDAGVPALRAAVARVPNREIRARLAARGVWLLAPVAGDAVDALAAELIAFAEAADPRCPLLPEARAALAARGSGAGDRALPG
ncbi:MAG: M50 family metallopeptidase [Deltaproteobacteria bacterium]|nr:M50 family metallopeptidase [Deltaproteobacteria bacterium]